MLNPLPATEGQDLEVGLHHVGPAWPVGLQVGVAMRQRAEGAMGRDPGSGPGCPASPPPQEPPGSHHPLPGGWGSLAGFPVAQAHPAPVTEGLLTALTAGFQRLLPARGAEAMLWLSQRNLP